MLTPEEAAAITDPREFERQVLEEHGLIPEIEPRYRSLYFSHVFSGGYSAGYYAYLCQKFSILMDLRPQGKW